MGGREHGACRSCCACAAAVWLKCQPFDRSAPVFAPVPGMLAPRLQGAFLMSLGQVLVDASKPAGIRQLAGITAKRALFSDVRVVAGHLPLPSLFRASLSMVRVGCLQDASIAEKLAERWAKHIPADQRGQIKNMVWPTVRARCCAVRPPSTSTLFFAAAVPDWSHGG